MDSGGSKKRRYQQRRGMFGMAAARKRHQKSIAWAAWASSAAKHIVSEMTRACADIGSWA